MKILWISDLHLGDAGSSPEFCRRRRAELRRRIAEISPDLVLDLGDTVSRAGVLRPGADPLALFREYRRWRESLGMPVRSCCLRRERGFFTRVLGQPVEVIERISPEVTLFMLSPELEFDHRFSAAQLRRLTAAAAAAGTRFAVVGTHVPLAGACSRTAEPGIYLDDSARLTECFAAHFERTFWGGGHFHWPAEPVTLDRAVTPFIAGFFRREREARPDYLRLLEYSRGGWKLRTLAPAGAG